MNKKVIIIGAGVAGISAGLNLAKAGFNIQIFESRKFIGGRFFSFREDKTGEKIDNGQHLFSGAYNEFFSILNELGTSIYLKSAGRLNIPFADILGEMFHFNTSLIPGTMGFIYGLIRFGALSFESKIKLLNFFQKVKRRKLNVQDLSCLELLIKENQNNELIKIFWTPLILAVLNGQPRDVAASLLIEVLERAFFAGGNQSELVFSSVDASTLLNPFGKWMERHGGKLHLQSIVKQIIIEDGIAKGIILKNGEKKFADSIITAVPPNVLNRILQNSDFSSNIKILSKFSFSPIINIYYWLDKHIETFNFISLLGTKSQWMFNLRNLLTARTQFAESYPGLINITISGGDELIGISKEKLALLCLDELKQNLTEFSNVNIMHKRVIKDKFATFKATTEVEKLRTNTLNELHNLYLAGDWTDTGLPATLESAAISGRFAAKLVVQQHI